MGSPFQQWFIPGKSPGKAPKIEESGKRFNRLHIVTKRQTDKVDEMHGPNDLQHKSYRLEG